MQTITLAADMKKMFVLSMLVSFAMICSCQKQNSAVEQQLAQRKVELDAREEALVERKSALDEREKALDEREKAPDEREKALAEKQKGTMNARPNPTNVQAQTPDPAQVQAERDRMIQQLSIPDSPSQRELNLSGAAVSPAAGAAAPTTSSALDATSPTPSPAPQ
jgi:hypothetical protein